MFTYLNLEWLRILMLPYRGYMEVFGVSVVVLLAVCFYKLVKSGEILADLSSDEAQVKAYGAHRMWRYMFDSLFVVAVCYVELLVQVKGIRSSSILKYLHYVLDGAFCISLVGAHVWNGSSEWGRRKHKYFAYATYVIGVFVLVTGLYLFYRFL